MLSSRAVLLVGDVIEPGHDLSARIGLHYRDVRHVPVGGGAVPVLLAGFDVDDVAGADLLDATVSCRDETDAVGDVESLALGVVVPGGASAGCEPYVTAPDRGLLVGVPDAVDVDGAGEPVRRPDAGLSVALGVLHDLVLLTCRRPGVRGDAVTCRHRPGRRCARRSPGLGGRAGRPWPRRRGRSPPRRWIACARDSRSSAARRCPGAGCTGCTA